MHAVRRSAAGGLLEAYKIKIEGLKKAANPWWAEV